jgi:chromosome segregation ATPase
VKGRNGRIKLFSRRAPAEERSAATARVEEVQAPVTPAEPVPAGLHPVAAELDPARPSETEAPEPSLNGADPAHQREDEWVRQLRQAAAMTPDESGDTAGALQSDLQLARKWAERANQLQGDLQEANARIRAAEAETQHAVAELEQLRAELDREQRDAREARSAVDAAQRELEATRAQADSLRAPADAAVRLSEELERALAAERERGDELARTLGRIRARLGDLDGAVGRGQAAPPPRA